MLGGGRIWGNDEADSDAARTIQVALDTGINLIDTAPAYGWGRSEKIVGQAVKGRRDKAVIATKCGLWWHDQRGGFLQNWTVSGCIAVCVPTRSRARSRTA